MAECSKPTGLVVNAACIGRQQRETPVERGSTLRGRTGGEEPGGIASDLADVGEQLVINFNVDYRQGILRMSDLLITGVL